MSKLKTLIRYGFVAIGLLVPPPSGGLPSEPCRWDNSYSTVVARARPYPKSLHSRVAAKELEGLREALVQLSVRARPEQEAQSQGRVAEEIRVEVIHSNPAGYRTVWARRTQTGTIAIVYNQGALKVTKLSEDQWIELAKLARSVEPRSLIGRRVEDGSAFFVSFSLAGACGQFALYNPIFSSVIPERDRVFNERVRPQKQLIDAVLRLSLAGD